MGFFKTLATGYKLMYEDFCMKHSGFIPKAFSGCGTGLMMIGSAVMAKTAMQEDVHQVISDCDKAIEEARKSKSKKYILKAHAQKTWKVVKVFRKGIALEAAGAISNGIGMHISESGRNKALAACATIGAQFAGYRAAVREDLGNEADIRYMTGRRNIKKTEHINKKTGEITEELERVTDDEFVIKKDPNAFRFWFSEDTCPSLWCSNYDLRLAKLKDIQNGLTLKLQANKHLTLNDMRREFGGYTPEKMDVGIGGIFGRVIDKSKPLMQQRVNLHFEDDVDFMEGRTDNCWLIFDCDPDPIIGKINSKFTEVKV